MAQDTNHLLQSYTDILEVNNTPRYDGVSPIQVDNINDTISINPGALSKIEPTDTVHVEQTTNNAGNLVYKLHVTHDAGKSYQGVYPVDVNNQTNEISVNNVGLDLQYPLFGTVDNDVLTLGSKLGYYYYPSTAATGASTLVSEINSMEYWCETNGDKSFRIRHDGALDPVGFGYTLPTMPSGSNGTYSFGGDRQWHSKTYYNWGTVYTTKSINPSTTEFYIDDIFSLDAGQEIEGVLYIDNIALDISTGNSWGNVKMLMDDGAETFIAKVDVNFDWGYNYGRTIVIPFYFKNTTTRTQSLDLKLDTGTRVPNTSTVTFRFNGWIM